MFKHTYTSFFDTIADKFVVKKEREKKWFTIVSVIAIYFYFKVSHFLFRNLAALKCSFEKKKRNGEVNKIFCKLLFLPLFIQISIFFVFFRNECESAFFVIASTYTYAHTHTEELFRFRLCSFFSHFAFKKRFSDIFFFIILCHFMSFDSKEFEIKSNVFKWYDFH